MFLFLFQVNHFAWEKRVLVLLVITSLCISRQGRRMVGLGASLSPRQKKKTKGGKGEKMNFRQTNMYSQIKGLDENINCNKRNP